MLIFGLAAAQEHVDAASEVRSRLAEARKALIRGGTALSELETSKLDAALTDAEQALARYEQLAVKGGARREAMVPLLATGATVVADDMTGIGVADDVLLPFIALGLLVAYLSTDAPTPGAELDRAWMQVVESLEKVSTTVTQLEAARKKNDGKCQCKCIRANDGPYPAGRLTRVDCERTCRRAGFTLAVCK